MLDRVRFILADMAPGLIYVRAGVEHIITRHREGWVNLRP